MHQPHVAVAVPPQVAAPPPRKCECTLFFSLHLTEMILGIIGAVLGIVFVVIAHIVFIWLAVTGLLAFASGLQGILVTKKGSAGYNCHIVLAVFNLVNMGIFGVASIILTFPLFIIWAIAAFVVELWVTIARFCCTTPAPVVTAPVAMYPVGQPVQYQPQPQNMYPPAGHPQYIPTPPPPPPHNYPPHENLKTPAYNH